MEKKRNSNVEALRIVAMLLIVAGHAAQHTDGYRNLTGSFSLNLFFTFVLGIWAQVGNLGAGCGVRLCGHNIIFYVRKGRNKICKNRRYCVPVVEHKRDYLRRKIDTGGGISKTTILKELLTPISGQYWFVVTYIAFYFFLPVLHRTIQNVGRKGLGKIAVVMAIFIPVYNFFFSNPGGSLADFVFIYFATAYLKKSQGNFIEKNCGKILAVSMAAMFFLCVAANWLGRKFALSESVVIKIYGRIFIMRHALVVLAAFSLFYVFRRLSFYSNVVNALGGYTLGVYLISENLLFRQIWKSAFHLDALYGTPRYPVAFVLSVLAVFIVCAGLECLRKNSLDKFFFKVFKVNDLCDKFDRWYNIL